MKWLIKTALGWLQHKVGNIARISLRIAKMSETEVSTKDRGLKEKHHEGRELHTVRLRELTGLLRGSRRLLKECQGHSTLDAPSELKT